MAKSKDHIHEFVKYKGKKGYWRCNDPGCFIVMPDEMVKGKLSLCPHCHLNTLTMTSYARQLAAPRCIQCSNRTQDKLIAKARSTVASISLEDLIGKQ